MGWLSDKLFGKKKKIDHNKLNSYQEPYLKMVNQYEDIAQGMMDPNSVHNQSKVNQLRANTYDNLGMQNQNLLSMGMMQNLSPAQMMAQQRAQSNQTLGNLGTNIQNLQSDQYNQGILNLQNVMGMRRGEADRLSNMHVQQVNASNAARQNRMSMTSGLIGMGLDFGSNFM